MRASMTQGDVRRGWTRRRFLASSASAAALALAAGAVREAPAAPGTASGDQRGGDDPAAAASGAAGTGCRPTLDLPIQGSPYLLTTQAPPDRGGIPEALGADPLIHFRCPAEFRDRLVLGLP